MGPSALLASLLSSYAPGILTRRSRGVTSSSVAPECLGDSKCRAGTRIHRLSFHRMRSTAAGRCIFEPLQYLFRGIAKLKGPKESTGRALVNCASGKYLSSLIKHASLDTNLERLVSSKGMLLQVL